jgi:hypothetical protein
MAGITVTAACLNLRTAELMKWADEGTADELETAYRAFSAAKEDFVNAVISHRAAITNDACGPHSAGVRL